MPASGIYTVIHDETHFEEHEVTAIAGEHFPPCRHCGPHPRFILLQAAYHIGAHEHFRKHPGVE